MEDEFIEINGKYHRIYRINKTDGFIDREGKDWSEITKSIPLSMGIVFSIMTFSFGIEIGLILGQIFLT